LKDIQEGKKTVKTVKTVPGTIFSQRHKGTQRSQSICLISSLLLPKI